MKKTNDLIKRSRIFADLVSFLREIYRKENSKRSSHQQPIVETVSNVSKLSKTEGYIDAWMENCFIQERI